MFPGGNKSLKTFRGGFCKDVEVSFIGKEPQSNFTN